MKIYELKTQGAYINIKVGLRHRRGDYVRGETGEQETGEQRAWSPTDSVTSSSTWLIRIV